MNGFTLLKRRLACGLTILLAFCLIAGTGVPVRAATDEQEDVYVVEKGDCLYGIGRETGADWKEIAERNGIKPPYTIYVGQELRLPAGAGAGSKETAKGVENAAAPGKEKEQKQDSVQAPAELTDQKADGGSSEKENAGETEAQKETDNSDNEPPESEDAPEHENETADAGNFDLWVVPDLLEGDCYGIYPLTWYQEDMRKPVTKDQLTVLMDGIGGKLLKIGGTTERYTAELTYSVGMTVEDLLNELFSKLSSYEYSESLGLEKRYSMVAYMMDYGIYTGENGEPGLEDVCSVQDACVYGTRVVRMAYDKLDAGSKGFLWEVSHEDNTVYLLGSVHFTSNDIYPFDEDRYDLFDSVDALVEEVDPYDYSGLVAFSETAVYLDGTTLKDHVPEELYEQAVKLASLLGLTKEVAAVCKPWYLANSFNTLAASGGSSLSEAQVKTSLGIDMHFLTRAYLKGMDVLEAEGYARQAAVMDSFSPELQEYLLKNAVGSLMMVLSGEPEAIPKMETQEESPQSERPETDASETDEQGIGGQNGDWLRMWKDGDFESFVKSYGAALSAEIDEVFENAEAERASVLKAEYIDKLVTGRDKGMAEYVDGLLKDGSGATYLVIVGAGHYVTESGILNQLESMGYQIKAIK